MDELTVNTEETEKTEAPIAEPTDGTEAEETDAPEHEAEEKGEIDYAKRLDEDLAQIREQFPSLHGIRDVTDLKDPLRFGALRDLGLTAKEAYLASGGKKRSYDNRTHLISSVPGGARSAVDGISRVELDMARDIFGSMSEGEIQKLYRKVTK